MEAQTNEAIKVASLLWVGIGVLLTSNIGVFIKMYFDHLRDRKNKREAEEKEKKITDAATLQSLIKALEENTKALTHFEADLQRVFTAVKLLAGKKWVQISKVIQEEIPRN